MGSINFTLEPTSEKGNDTIAVHSNGGKKSYLHSKISPSKETDSFYTLINQIDSDTIILFGAGLGYHLPSFTKVSSIKNIIVIEKLPLKEKLINKFQQINLFTFLCGLTLDELENALEEILDLNTCRKISFIDHPASIRIFSDYYAYAHTLVDRVIRKKAGTITTLNVLSNLFIRNCIKKICSLEHYLPFSTLHGTFTDKPCIIVSSAPSTDSFIRSISAYKDKLYILCVDSAFHILKAHGIKPDFLISSDPQPWTEEHLLNYDRSIPIITSLSSHLSFCHSQRLFLYLNSHPFSQVLEQLIPNIGSADSKTGTVAGDALAAAVFMGFGPIYFCGTDFSFPDHIIYSKDTSYNIRYSSIFNNRLSPCESLHMKYIRRSKNTIDKTGLVTRNSFIQYRDSFEKFFREVSPSIIHLYDKGLSISGCSILKNNEIEQRLSEFPLLPDKFKNMESIITQQKHLPKIDIESIFTQKKFLREVITESATDEYMKKRLPSIERLITKLIQDAK